MVKAKGQEDWIENSLINQWEETKRRKLLLLKKKGKSKFNFYWWIILTCFCFFIVVSVTHNYLPTVSPFWNRKKWKPGKKLMRLEGEQVKFQNLNIKIMKDNNKKWKLQDMNKWGNKNKETELLWWEIIEIVRKIKLKMPFYSTKTKKRNKLNLLVNKGNKGETNLCMFKIKKIKWGRKCKNNKKHKHKRKLKNLEEKNKWLHKPTSLAKSQRKKKWLGKKNLKLCKWKCSKWNWLKSCKTLKPYKNKHTLNSKKR